MLYIVYMVIVAQCMQDWSMYYSKYVGHQKYSLVLRWAFDNFWRTLQLLANRVPAAGGERAAPLSRVCCTDFRMSWNVFIWDSSHRFVPVCFPVLLLAAPPEPHCADCFFLGAGAFALPLKAFVASSLFRWTSPAGSDGLTSLLNIRGWYSDAHCCGGDGS